MNVVTENVKCGCVFHALLLTDERIAELYKIVNHALGNSQHASDCAKSIADECKDLNELFIAGYIFGELHTEYMAEQMKKKMLKKVFPFLPPAIQEALSRSGHNPGVLTKEQSDHVDQIIQQSMNSNEGDAHDGH